jgi:hypothetical protein
MAARTRAEGEQNGPTASYARFSAAVDLLRRGETVLTLIDPAARTRDPDAFAEWLRARLTIAELPRLLQRPCDERCVGVAHHPDAYVVLSDLALDPAAPRRGSWWGGWNASLERAHQSGRIWFAGAPTLPVTPRRRRLATGTRLRRIATTDPYWVAYDGAPQETLFRIEDGPHAGASLVAVTFGHAPLLPALAGVLVAPDHAPNRDPVVAIRTLAAGWAAVERGLPYEE